MNARFTAKARQRCTHGIERSGGPITKPRHSILQKCSTVRSTKLCAGIKLLDTNVVWSAAAVKSIYPDLAHPAIGLLQEQFSCINAEENSVCVHKSNN